MPQQHSTVIPAFRYRDAQAAMEWLCGIFGFEKKAVYPGENGTIAHAELALGGGMIMLGTMKDDEHSVRFKAPDETGGVETGGAYVVVEDADAAYARAQAAGAVVVRPLQETPYGSREFSVKDPEGHTWSAGTYDPWASRG